MSVKLTLESLLSVARPFEIMHAMAQICYERRMDFFAQRNLPMVAYWSDQQALFEVATLMVRENELRLSKRQIG